MCFILKHCARLQHLSHDTLKNKTHHANTYIYIYVYIHRHESPYILYLYHIYDVCDASAAMYHAAVALTRKKTVNIIYMQYRVLLYP